MTVASDKLLYIISPERLHHFKRESKLINQFERVCFCRGDIVHKFIRGYSHLWLNPLSYVLILLDALKLIILKWKEDSSQLRSEEVQH